MSIRIDPYPQHSNFTQEQNERFDRLNRARADAAEAAIEREIAELARRAVIDRRRARELEER